jgi:uncharacterized protein
MNDDDPDRPEPVIVPVGELSPEAQKRLVEAFVLREGTEYGAHDVALEDKVADVMRQLDRGEAQIVFDPATESVDIIVARSRPVRPR